MNSGKKNPFSYTHNLQEWEMFDDIGTLIFDCFVLSPF